MTKKLKGNSIKSASKAKQQIAKPKKTKAKSKFSKDVTLFRDQKDFFSLDKVYAD